VAWAVSVMHQQLEAAHEGVLRREPRDQPPEQHAGTLQHLLGGVGAAEELEAALEGRGQDDGLARIGPLPERRIELDQHRLAEAARQPGARQAEQIAELGEAHALQRFPVLAAGAEQPHRHLF
jgi:hypothetical protein